MRKRLFFVAVCVSLAGPCVRDARSLDGPAQKTKRPSDKGAKTGEPAIQSKNQPAAELYGAYMDCRKALEPYVPARDQDLGRSGNILVAAKDKAGFYVYTRVRATFYPFPQPPASSGLSRYYLKLPVSEFKDDGSNDWIDSGTIHITYAYDAEHPDASEVSQLGKSVPDSVFATLQGKELIDSQAAHALSGSLGKRIGAVHEAYESRKKKLGRPLDKQEWLNCLKKCDAVPDDSIKRAASGETDKFKDNQ